MVAPNLGVIPHFIYASSPKTLKSKMLRNNSKFGVYLTYFDIQFVEKENRWVAWFNVDIQRSIENAYKNTELESSEVVSAD